MGESVDAGLRAFDESRRFAFDVFISYSVSQTARAEELLRDLTQHRLKNFYAPRDLEGREVAPNQYVEALRAALIQSCQVVVLLSASYLDSSWCQLEMRGYFGLVRNDRRRRLWIRPLEAVDDQIDGQLVPFLVRGSFAEVASEARRAADTSGISVGDAFSQGELPRTFVELPLRAFYEPPTRSNRPPWGKDHRSPHGVPGAPPFAVYELLVREYMVQIMRGRTPGTLDIPMAGVREVYAYFSDDARRDATKLIEMGVSPLRLPFTYPLRERLRDIESARREGQDPAEMDRLEGQAWARAGSFDKGIALMTSGLSAAHEGLRDRSQWITEIALAEYLAHRHEAALTALLPLRDSGDVQAGLVRSAALARLDRLSAEERRRNRESPVRVNDIRINSHLERREDLDWWADGLELAGFQR